MTALAQRRPQIIVLAGGVEQGHVPDLPEPDTVIAADSGLALAKVLGLRADVVAGDMDSVDPALLEAARSDGALVDTHPVDKDMTDLAIALDLALGYAPASVTVVGGHGGRLDHHLANLLLLGADPYAPLELTAHMGGALVTVVRDRRSLRGRPGETVSLLPLHGPATDVHTSGLRFPLVGEELSAGSSRGVSNEFLHDTAEVRLDRGVLVAIQPHFHDVP